MFMSNLQTGNILVQTTQLEQVVACNRQQGTTHTVLCRLYRTNSASDSRIGVTFLGLPESGASNAGAW